MKRLFIMLTALSMMTSCGSYHSYTDTIQLNGQSIFYAAEGRGKPVILIHGNGGSHCDLETMQRQLASAGYCVYALDSRGQGANAPLTEYHYKDMAEDVLAFIKAKGLKRPAVYGWSDGGIVALELESMHPGTCGLIATSGANATAENAIAPQTELDIFGPPENLPNLAPLTRMMKLEPNMTKEDLERIKVPVMVCAGENDLILPEHTSYIAKTLPCGEMKIIPGHDHGSYIWHNPMMGIIFLEFLKRFEY